MKVIENFDLINEAGEFKQLPAGIYKLQIKEVVDVSEKEYLDIHFDIVDGEYKNYFVETQKGYGSAIRSYKFNALPFFKAFITSVEKTNPGYKWDWDENKLAGKYVVGVFGEEEFVKDNEVKVGTKLVEFRSKEAFLKGEIKVPERKCLTEEEKAKLITPTTTPGTAPVLDDNFPW